MYLRVASLKNLSVSRGRLYMHIGGDSSWNCWDGGKKKTPCLIDGDPVYSFLSFVFSRRRYSFRSLTSDFCPRTLHAFVGGELSGAVYSSQDAFAFYYSLLIKRWLTHNMSLVLDEFAKFLFFSCYLIPTLFSCHVCYMYQNISYNLYAVMWFVIRKILMEDRK